jgi:hypothetical protein
MVNSSSGLKIVFGGKSRISSRLTVCKFCINQIIFRLLMIIRILLLYLYLIQSFLGNCTKFLVTFIELVHYLDNLFIWLCERDYLRNIYEYYKVADLFTYSSGIWILLFVVTGPKFWGGFKNAWVWQCEYNPKIENTGNRVIRDTFQFLP